MRRDYFTCVFLACIAASLFFVWLLPLYFTYDLVIPREFGLLETIASFAFAATVLIIIPVASAWTKKFWVAAGLAFYGVIPYLPLWFLPKVTATITEGKASVVSSLTGFLLKSIYGMVNAPFAPLSKYLGDDSASALSLWIMPVSICVYIFFQVVRFYRDAYVAEQLDPQSVVDSTAKENKHHVDDEALRRKMREARTPEVLGTVISAPVSDRKGPAPVKEVRPQPVKPPAGPAVAEGARKATVAPGPERPASPGVAAGDTRKNPNVEAGKVRQPAPGVEAGQVRKPAPGVAGGAGEKAPAVTANSTKPKDETIYLGPPKGTVAPADDDGQTPILLGPPKMVTPDSFDNDIPFDPNGDVPIVFGPGKGFIITSTDDDDNKSQDGKSS